MKKNLPFRVLPAGLVPLFLSITVMATTAAEATQSTRPAARPELRIALKYVPTDAEEVLEKRGVMTVAGPPFEILAVVDDRPEPRNLIGQSIDRKKVPIPVRAKQQVAAWLHQVLEWSFAEWGTPGKPGADLLLEPVVIRFFVVEENSYKAEVTMKFLLKRRDGTEIWVGVVGGTASRFGRWLNESNYQEVVSDAVLACYSKLWADPGFREAWAGKTTSRDVTAGRREDRTGRDAASLSSLFYRPESWPGATDRAEESLRVAFPKSGTRDPARPPAPPRTSATPSPTRARARRAARPPSRLSPRGAPSRETTPPSPAGTPARGG